MCDKKVLHRIMRRQERILEFAALHLKKPKSVKHQRNTTFFEGTRLAGLRFKRRAKLKKMDKLDYGVVPQSQTCSLHFLSNPRSWHTPIIKDERKDQESLHDNVPASRMDFSQSRKNSFCFKSSMSMATDNSTERKKKG
jgi:hypothetical protein